MTLLDHLITRDDVDDALDTYIKARTAHEDAMKRWACWHPVCLALAAEAAEAQLAHERISRIYYAPRKGSRL